MNRYTTFQEWTTILSTLTTQVQKPGMELPKTFCEQLAALNAACARNINNKPPEKQHA
jgi:hypothetical protein